MVVLIGMFFLGFVQALSFIPVLPEVVDILTIEYKLVEGTDEETEGLLHDTIAALYNLWYSSSSLLSPILGGLLFDTVGYKGTMNISMAGILLITAVYYFYNCGTKIFETTKIEMDEVKRLKGIKEKLDKIKKGLSIDDESPSPVSEAEPESPQLQSESLDDSSSDNLVLTNINN